MANERVVTCALAFDRASFERPAAHLLIVPCHCLPTLLMVDLVVLPALFVSRALSDQMASASASATGGGGGGGADKKEGAYVTTGDVIPVDVGFIRGHGTLMRGDRLVASVSGFVERVNKLVSVRPLSSRYTGEIGDVVIGRIVEVADKRWKVDLKARQHATLMLSSVTLPGGVQRRRTEADELQMRTLFTENDLISAEVQNVAHDGFIALHTRSAKYGKVNSARTASSLSSLSPVAAKRSLSACLSV
jgi:exosome complex RNA-binding protein Rrp4